MENIIKHTLDKFAPYFKKGQFPLSKGIGSIHIEFSTKHRKGNVHLILIELSVVIIGIAILTFLLGLNALACCGLTLFISIISISYIKLYNNHFHENFGLCGLMTFIGVSTLIDLANTPEFNMYYPHLSETDVFILYMGTARIITGILFTAS